MQFHGTTVLFVKKGNSAVMISDGQLTLGHVKVKDNTRKVRKLSNNKVLAAFAGTHEGLIVVEALEKKTQQYPNQLSRAIIELSRQWNELRLPVKADIQIVVADMENVFIIGSGAEIVTLNDNVASIGSGGFYALSAAKALLSLDELSLTAEDVAKKAMQIASELCIYTNSNFSIEKLEA